jgi:LPXTG-site transpeptidase (sortase) family protein
MTLRVEYEISPQEPASVPATAMSHPRKSRTARGWFVRWAAPLLLFLIGCFALGYYAYDILDARYFQDEQSRQFDQALSNAHDDSAISPPSSKSPAEELRAEALADLKSREKQPSTPPKMPAFAESASANEPKQPETAAGNIPLGRIEIASVGLSAMIQEGTSNRTLQRGVGHIAGTALLGKSGNVGLAAHRDTFFRKLRDIKSGDDIKLTTLAGSVMYRVELISIVEPEDSRVLADSGENTLTLVTCYPFSYIGPAPKRFIVRARQISSASAPVAAIN